MLSTVRPAISEEEKEFSTAVVAVFGVPVPAVSNSSRVMGVLNRSAVLLSLPRSRLSLF